MDGLKFATGIHRGLTVLAIGGWILALIDKFVRPRFAIADAGAMVGMVALCFLIPLGTATIWGIKKIRLRQGKAWRRFSRLSQVFVLITWLVSCIPVGLYAFLVYAASVRYEERTERIDLLSGDTLLNHTYVTRFRDVTRYNEYRIQFRAAASEEHIGTVYGDEALLEKHDNVALVRDGDHIALIAGPHVFKRWGRKGKPWWYHWEARLDREVFHYIKGLALDDEPFVFQGEALNHLQARQYGYVVEHLDLAAHRLTLVAVHDAQALPQRLAYVSQDFTFPWHFDPERTAALNPTHAFVPFPQGITAEYLLVTFPHTKGESLTLTGFSSVMGRSGAQVAVQRVLELDTVTLSPVQVEITLPNGQRINRSFEIKGGWGDRRKDKVSIFFRYPWTPSPGWTVVTLGERRNVGASGYEGTAVYAYLRIYREEK